MMKRNDGSLLAMLRVETRAAHLLLEQHPLLVELTAGNLSLERYAMILGAFLDVYRTLEPYLTAAAPMGAGRVGYRYLPRIPLLIDDLAAIGRPAPASGGDPRVENGSADDLDVLLGRLYVVEGSSQGGRVLGPQLCRALSLSSSRGARYFHLFQQGQWFTFRRLLEEADPCSSLFHRVTEASRDTFALFGAHLNTRLEMGDATDGRAAQLPAMDERGIFK